MSAFLDQLRPILGQETEAFHQALHTAAPTSIRLHPRKAADMEQVLPEFSASSAPIPWAARGIYLDQRPLFTAEPALHGGGFYVQEASSMLLEQLWKQTAEPILRAEANGKPLVVLDLCAAPGGKSTHLVSLLQPDDLLVANEVIRSRAKILAENLQKWGYAQVLVANNDPRDYAQRLPETFDAIVIDAPCSGEGMFRKLPHARLEWSLEAVAHCAARQRRILAEAWEALKPGGVLIYSTCTFNRAENEENLAWLVAETDAEPLTCPMPADWGIWEEPHAGIRAYRAFPHRLRGEGFCIAALRKPGQAARDRSKFELPKQVKLLKNKQVEPIRDWVQHPDEWAWVEVSGLVRAFPKSVFERMLGCYQRLHVVYGGVSVAETDRAGFHPTAELAWWTGLASEAFQRVELDRAQALAYLKLEGFGLSPDAPNGWLLAAYRGLPLGFLKNMGSRFNNYFPKNYKIRMDIPATDEGQNDGFSD